MTGPKIGASLMALLFPALALCQEATGSEPARDFSTAKPSYELMASGVFRTISAVVPVTRRVAAEVHYFGLPEAEPRVNVVQALFSYQVPLGRYGFIAPGAGTYFGVEHAALSVSVRWLVEAGRVVSEGLFAQGTGTPDSTERAQIWDGNHVSLTFLERRLEIGPTWEHIHVREENEWKWGGRLAGRVSERILLVVYALTPGETEWRAGFSIR